VVAWIIASLVLAAVLAPWVCRGGQWLAAEAQMKELPRLIEWVAESCGRAKFSRFFDRSLLFSALFFLPFLIRRIRWVRSTVPSRSGVQRYVMEWRTVAWQIMSGFLIAATLLALLCLGVAMAGGYVARPEVGGMGKYFQKAVVPAVFAALVEEWLFRGLLYGICLRFVRPWSAVLGTAFLFSLLHFLHPPAGVEFADPRHPLAGFVLLGSIVRHFTDPLFFVTDFATLLFVGIILGWARMKTGALWFGVGLHAGWILALKSCSFFFTANADHFLRPWWIGSSLRSGILPLLVLGLTAALCAAWMRLHAACPSSSPKQCDGDD
jgi:membrane protease YdiL (CAAX protease family)